MTALFARWSNTLFAVTTGSVALAGTSALLAPLVLIRTPYGNGVGRPVEQPVEFDHRHHARDNGIACLYCHDGAEDGRHAGIPESSVCMGCHGQVWSGSALLAPVRESYFRDQSIAWRRVYDIPDYVYFHHGVHVQQGIACERCHGEVEQMARPYREHAFTMEFCLDCHRQQAPLARGETTHFNPDLPDRPRAITSLTTCTACHR